MKKFYFLVQYFTYNFVIPSKNNKIYDCKQAKYSDNIDCNGGCDDDFHIVQQQ